MRTPYWLGLLTLLLIHPSPVQALDLIQTKTATVSATVQFTTSTPFVDETAPTAPILIHPTDGSYKNTKRPEFIWTRSTDPNGNFIEYTLYLNNVATYLGINNTGNSSSASYSSRVSDNTIVLTPSQDLPEGIYDWKVVASDYTGNTQSSTQWRFIIDSSSPRLTLTQLGDIKSPDITTATPFTFSGSLDLKFITSSEPYVTISLTLYNQSTQQSTTLVANTASYNSSTFTPYLAVGSYQVIIQASDQAGNTTPLPTFYISVVASQAGAPLFPKPLPPLSIPSIPSLPATASYIATRVTQASTLYYLLALIAFILIISRSKKNVRLLSQLSGKPIADAKLYTIQDRSYFTNAKGEAYIPNLTSHTYLLVMIKSQQSPIALCILKPSQNITIIKL